MFHYRFRPGFGSCERKNGPKTYSTKTAHTLILGDISFDYEEAQILVKWVILKMKESKKNTKEKLAES